VRKIEKLFVKLVCLREYDSFYKARIISCIVFGFVGRNSKMKKLLWSIFDFILGFVTGNITGIKCLEKKIVKREKEIYRFRIYYDMLRKWIEAKQKGKSLEDLLLEKGYKNIAVYGIGEIGILLLDELKNTSINVVYGIDKSDIVQNGNLEIVKPQGELKKVDAIIVSAVFVYDEIAAMLESLVDCPIVAMDDLIYEMA